MKNAFLILAALVVTLASYACGDTCSSLCDKHNQCMGAYHQQCDAVCNASSDTASQLGCSSQYDTLETCLADPPPPATVCDDAADRCSVQQTAYDECRTAYCAMHADAAACRTP